MTNGGHTSPEGILMLCAAGIFDGIGLILLCFGVDDFFILDICGAIFFGSWIGTRERAAGAKKILNKFLVTLGFELPPYLGGISPSWTIFVWRELN